MFTEISNKAAYHHFYISDLFIAGVQLLGTEVKSIRAGKVNMGDCFCFFVGADLYIKNMHISEYAMGNLQNHEPMRIRKLLLHKTELKKLKVKVKEKGFTIIPTKLMLSETGYIKAEIGLAKGKNVADKRDTLKKKEATRELSRLVKFK
jgi:SsrA-binding protein